MFNTRPKSCFSFPARPRFSSLLTYFTVNSTTLQTQTYKIVCCCCTQTTLGIRVELESISLPVLQNMKKLTATVLGVQGYSDRSLNHEKGAEKEMISVTLVDKIFIVIMALIVLPLMRIQVQ